MVNRPLGNCLGSGSVGEDIAGYRKVRLVLDPLVTVDSWSGAVACFIA